MRSTKEELNSQSVTYSSSSVLEAYNTVVVTNSGFPTVLSSSQNLAMPVKHNVSLLNLPDVEEVPSHDGETILLWCPEKEKRNTYRCGQHTVRLAGCRIQSFSRKARSLRAQAQLIETRTETLTFEKRAERKTEVREQALSSSHQGNPIVEKLPF
ncbi:phosphatase and actin regulator 2 [Trichonephila clavipes]|nr:phosphatase and actin regulator 2 [Trichonephila clavipes]